MGAFSEKFIVVNEYSRPGTKLEAIRKLVIHYTANPGASAENHYKYFGTLKDRYASAHIFVDKTEAINIIPLNEVAYHAGDVQKRNEDGTAWRGVKELLPSANYLSIGVEMCIEKDGSFHPDTISRTEDVFVELCKKFKLNPLNDIVRHHDVTWKNCPAPWVTDVKQFEDFKTRVNAKLNPSVPAPKKDEPVVSEIKPYVPVSNGVIAKVQVKVDGLNIRVAPDTKAAIVRQANKGEQFDVYANVNDWHNVGGANWVFGGNGEYLSLIKQSPVYPGHIIEKGSDDHASVKLIQSTLGIQADGIFGNGTWMAVRNFQAHNQLTVDGVIGPKTWEKIFK